MRRGVLRVASVLGVLVTAGAGCLAVAPTAAATAAPGAPAAASTAAAPAAILGEWEGSYTCAQVLTGLDLRIQAAGKGGALRAIFSFYPLTSNPDVPVGIFVMGGTYFSASRIVLRDRRWILNPPGYVMDSLSGALARGRFRGAVQGPACTRFALAKVAGHPTRSRVLGSWKGSYLGCAQGPTGLRLVVRAKGRTGNQLTATFNFYALPSNPTVPSGSYAMTGYYFPGGVALEQSHWIKQPPGYEMVNVVGKSPVAGGKRFGGVIVDCSKFSLVKEG